jgi:hypothetical protein
VLNGLGRHDEARSELEQLAESRFGTIPRDGIWLGAISYLAEVAVALGDRSRAATLYELMRPFRHRNVTIGWSSSCTGSASRPLGLLAELLDRRDDAAKHFDDALAKNEAMGAEPWVARTCVAYGRFLRDSPESADRSRGVELIDRGLATARGLGMTPLAREASSALAAAAAR